VIFLRHQALKGFSLRIRIGSGLILQGILIIVLIIIVTLIPSNILRIIIGLPFVLFSPGYTLMLALFPKRGQIGNIERVALSFGMSITIVPLIGLIMDNTPWGITIESTLYSITGFIFIVSIIAWFRLWRLSEYVRFSIEFEIRLPDWRGSRWDKALSVILIVAILGSLGALGYVLATPKVGERFTQFYILNMEGKATDYPDMLSVGEQGQVIAGIINNEHKVTTYRIEIKIKGDKESLSNPITLEDEGKWEEIITFTPASQGENQKVEFLLYKNNEPGVYQSLHIWIDVTAQE